MFRKLLDEARAGDNVGVLLRGTKKDDVERGMVIAKPGSIKPHKKFKAEIYVLSKEEGGRHTPFFTNYRPQFYFRTTDVTGTREAARRRRNGHAWRQRLDRSRARSPRSPWKRPCASPSAKVARPSAPVASREIHRLSNLLIRAAVCNPSRSAFFRQQQYGQ